MLVIFEGIDCVGKTTQINLLKEIYKDAITTKEPGGTEFGKKVRNLLLNGDEISKKAELFLFLADRNEHYEKVIKPNLNNLILSDRSFISGISYALTNDKNLNIDELINLNKFALNGHFGDKFIFIKADENTLKNRLFNKKLDNIEKRGIKYLLRVQENMEMILNYLKFEVLKLNASDEISNIHAKIKEFIKW